MVTTLLLNLFVVYSCHWGPWNLKSIYTMAPLLVQNKNKTCSVDTASWALDGPLWHSHDVKNNGIPRNCSNASLITKGDQELTWQYPLSKFHSKQARVLLCKSILHFTMGFYGSPCDYTQNHCLSTLYVTKLVTLVKTTNLLLQCNPITSSHRTNCYPVCITNY